MSGDKQLEERRKYVTAFNSTMVKIWREQINLLGVIDTGALYRSTMAVLTLERVKLEQNCIYLDPRISFNEIDRYFFSGCACAYFQVAVDVFTDLRYNADEWG